MDESKNHNILEIFKLNKVIWFLTFSDILTWGLYLPLSALVGIYLSNLLGFNTVEIVGIGVGLFYLVRSISQIPIGILVDKIKRDTDDILILIAGNLFLGVPFLLFPIINNSSTFYILQITMGLGASMNLVTWRKMFAKNLDKGKEGTSYAVYDTVFSASIALFSLIMGTVANINQAYFDFVMISVGLLIVLSTIFPLSIFVVKNRRSSRL